MSTCPCPWIETRDVSRCLGRNVINQLTGCFQALKSLETVFVIASRWYEAVHWDLKWFLAHSPFSAKKFLFSSHQGCPYIRISIQSSKGTVLFKGVESKNRVMIVVESINQFSVFLVHPPIQYCTNEPACQFFKILAVQVTIWYVFCPKQTHLCWQA